MSIRSHFRLGAILSGTQEYIVPETAKKGYVYECPECKNIVIFKKGEIKKPYFSHKATTNLCTYYTRPSESQLHKDAKLRLKYLIDKKETLTICKMCKNCEKGDTIILSYQSDFFPKLEHSFWMNDSRKQADLAYINNAEDILFILEVFNTHYTDEGNRPEPYYEINALDVISNNTTFKFNCCRKIWTTNCKNCLQKEKFRKEEDCRKKEEHRLKKEFEEKEESRKKEESRLKKEFEEEEKCRKKEEIRLKKEFEEEEYRLKKEQEKRYREEQEFILTQENEKQLFNQTQKIKEQKKLLKFEAKKRKTIKEHEEEYTKKIKIKNIDDTIDILNNPESTIDTLFEYERELYINKIKKSYPQISNDLSFVTLKQIFSLCLEKNKLMISKS